MADFYRRGGQTGQTVSPNVFGVPTTPVPHAAPQIPYAPMPMPPPMPVPTAPGAMPPTIAPAGMPTLASGARAPAPTVSSPAGVMPSTSGGAPANYGIPAGGSVLASLYGGNMPAQTASMPQLNPQAEAAFNAGMTPQQLVMLEQAMGRIPPARGAAPRQLPGAPFAGQQQRPPMPPQARPVAGMPPMPHSRGVDPLTGANR